MPDRTTDLLHTRDAALYLVLSPSMLERLRYLGEGPPYIRVTGARAIRYRNADLVAWTDVNRVVPNSRAVS